MSAGNDASDNASLQLAKLQPANPAAVILSVLQSQNSHTT